MEKKITAIAWDYIEDESGSFPIVRSMSEIAGTTSVLIAAELMSNANDGKGLMLGGLAGITPPEMDIGQEPLVNSLLVPHFLLEFL